MGLIFTAFGYIASSALVVLLSPYVTLATNHGPSEAWTAAGAPRGASDALKVLYTTDVAVLRASNGRDLHLVTPCMQMDLSHARSVGYETAVAFLPTPLAASRELILAL